MLPLVLLLLGLVFAANGSFMVGDYPNPMNNASLWKCGILSAGALCDPDSLLNNTARAEALQLFKDFPDQTDIDNNGDGGCKSQGVIIGLAMSKQAINPQSKRVNVTDDLMKNVWKLDTKCNKALMLTLSVQPNPVVRFTRYMTTPVFDDELHHLIWTEMHWLREKNYIMWIRLMLDGLRSLVNDRHGTMNVAAKPSTKSCVGYGFVILSAFIAIWVSVALTLSAPYLFEQCHRRFGHIIGKPAPFPMVRFTNGSGGGVGQNGMNAPQQ